MVRMRSQAGQIISGFKHTVLGCFFLVLRSSSPGQLVFNNVASPPRFSRYSTDATRSCDLSILRGDHHRGTISFRVSFEAAIRYNAETLTIETYVKTLLPFTHHEILFSFRSSV